MFVPQTNVGRASSASSVDSRGFGFQTHFSSDPVAEKWLQTHFVLRFDGVMKCEREVRKGGKFWLKYFEGTEKEKCSEARWHDNTEAVGSIEVKNFTILPLSYASQKDRNWVSYASQKLRAMKTRLGNQTKPKKIVWIPHWVSSNTTQNWPKRLNHTGS